MYLLWQRSRRGNLFSNKKYLHPDIVLKENVVWLVISIAAVTLFIDDTVTV